LQFGTFLHRCRDAVHQESKTSHSNSLGGSSIRFSAALKEELSMSLIYVRATLLAVAALLVAGCAGSGSPALQAQGVTSAGLPFTTKAAHQILVRAAEHPNYSTKQSLLFEADFNTSAVNIYQTSNLSSNPAPIATLNTLSGCPDGLALDKKGTLYVADECVTPGNIGEFPKGSTTEKTAITGINAPSGLTIDSNGVLYVSTYPASIEEFKPGSTSAYQTITGQGLTNPFGLTVDKSNNLYIADFGADQVFEVAAGTTTVTPLNLEGTLEPVGVAVDFKTGDLWEADSGLDVINVYRGTRLIKSLPGWGDPYAIDAQNEHKPNGTVVLADTSTDSIYAFKSGKYTPYATLTNGVGFPLSVLLAKP
jgi:hypothetical protein